MIVQCDQCNAKFRLDDSKVKEGGVKVRCSKCKNIFVVKTEPPVEEADFDDFLSGLIQPPSTAAGDSGEPAPSVAASPPRPEPAAGWELEDEAATKEQVAPHVAPSQEDIDLNEFTFDQQTFGEPPAPAPVTSVGGGDEADSVFGELDLGSGQPKPVPEVPEQREVAALHDEFEFQDEPAAPPIPEFELDVFGEPGTPLTPAAATAQKTEGELSLPAPEAFSFSSEAAGKESASGDEDFFADAAPGFSFEPDAAFTATPVQAAEKSETGQPVSFDFGEFEFGESAGGPKEDAVPQKREKEEAAPAYSQISAPSLPEMPSFDDELPPLSISTRRRGGSGLPIAVTAFSVLLVLVLAGGGFYVFKGGPAAFNKLGLGFMAKWFGVVSKEEGGVAIRNTVGTFLNNKETGEIFAINGEAVNNFGKPRASVQVKATLYGAKGEVLLQKTAYCGNILSREQLSTLPAAKLEAAMNNQFGDSLSNLAVQPGKGIPFVVVLTNVPKDVVEFGVEVVGSTVASQ